MKLLSSIATGTQRGLRADLVPLFLLLVVYGKAGTFPFVRWDDPLAILDNPLIRHPLAQGWGGLLLTRGLGYPQPLTVLSHHLDWLVGGGAAWAFHVSSLLLHGLCVLLLRRIALSLGASHGAALFAAALFAVHPIVAEPVCWATGRKDLLAAFGVLLATWAVTSRPSHVLALCAGVAIAFLSKPTGWIVPLWLAWYFAVVRARPPRSALVVSGVAVAGALLLAPLAYRSHARFGGFVERSLFDAVRFAVEHAALQARNVLLPVRLSPFYLEGLPMPWASLWGALGLALLVAAVVALKLAWRRDERVAFGLGASVIAFAPASGLVALHRGPADSYVYLPFAALALASSTLVDRALTLRPQLAAWLAGLVLCVYGGLGFVQAETWRSSVALFSPAVELYPDSAYAHETLANAYFAEGSPRDGVVHFQRSLELAPYPPPRPEPISALGFACYQLRELPCATKWYAEAVRHYPDDFGRALRLVSAASALQQEPAAAAPLVATYSRELAKAGELVATRLRSLSELPEAQRPPALAETFARELKEDNVPMLALLRYSQQTELKPAAGELLRLYQER